MKTIINTITKKDFRGKEIDFKNLITNIEDWKTWQDGLFDMKSNTVKSLRIPRSAEITSIIVHDDLHMEIEYFMNGTFYNVKSYLISDEYKLEKGKSYIVETHTLMDIKRQELDFASNIISSIDWNEYRHMMLTNEVNAYLKSKGFYLKEEGNKVNKIMVDDKKHLEVEYFNKLDKHFYNSKSYMFIA